VAGTAGAAAADPVDEPDEEPDDGPGELTAADRVPPPVGDCSANITTLPAGALVRANGRYYGETPLEAALPCGSVDLQISYRRYATVEKKLTLSAATPVELKVPLERPRHKVRIVSTPGGATVSINGSKVGTTPMYAKVPGYSMLTIELRRAGYKTLRLKHYSKRTGGVVAGRLEKGR
ncbi:MAG: PEGA domain-containing protein, partial [Deltaproteobacteria bacterium]|nr:PEGA domain-containing protein [Kofleriaceae bacterium]